MPKPKSRKTRKPRIPLWVPLSGIPIPRGYTAKQIRDDETRVVRAETGER